MTLRSKSFSYAHYTDEKTKVQREIICSESYSQEAVQSQNSRAGGADTKAHAFDDIIILLLLTRCAMCLGQPPPVCAMNGWGSGEAHSTPVHGVFSGD